MQKQGVNNTQTMSQPAANAVAENSFIEFPFPFVDNRQEAIFQRKIKEMANNKTKIINNLPSDGQLNVAPIVQMMPDGLDMATCNLVGIINTDDRSEALVESRAIMSDPSHRVIYEIKWDAAVVPGGDHLGQLPNQASDWIVDRSPTGIPIGDRNDPNAPYFDNDADLTHDLQGRYFTFNDNIVQGRLRGGSWWFRLKIVDLGNNVLSMSHEVEVSWV